MPCYNAGKMLDRSVAQILSQSIKPAAILLMDDGSSPALELSPKLAEMQKGWPLEIIRDPVNRGLASVRNAALARCRTRLIASLDADVAAEHNWLEMLLNAINAQHVAGVGGRLDEFYQESLADRWRAVHMAQHWGDNPVLNPRFIYGANSLFQAEILCSAGGYHSSLRTNYEDMSLSEKLYSQKHMLYYEPAAKCRHLRRDNLRSVLPGFWKWYHAKGVIQGEFDSPEGLLGRIERVNFGIFRHRFDMDANAGRKEFLILDLLLPWVFCALDLELAQRLKKIPCPAFPNVSQLEFMPAPLRKLLPEILAPSQNTGTTEPWHESYYKLFEESLNNSWHHRIKLCGDAPWPKEDDIR